MNEAPPGAIEATRRIAEQRQITHVVRYVGVRDGKPLFEFQGLAPPDWLRRAFKRKLLRIVDGATWLRGRKLEPGAPLYQSEVRF